MRALLREAFLKELRRVHEETECLDKRTSSKRFVPPRGCLGRAASIKLPQESGFAVRERDREMEQ